MRVEWKHWGKNNLCGIQVMSEPHLHTDEGHAFLESYYQQAILAARDFLDPSVPIVLFEWTYEMSKWDENAFPEAMYGKVAHLKMKGSCLAEATLQFDIIWWLIIV